MAVGTRSFRGLLALTLLTPHCGDGGGVTSDTGEIVPVDVVRFGNDDAPVPRDELTVLDVTPLPDSLRLPKDLPGGNAHVPERRLRLHRRQLSTCLLLQGRAVHGLLR